MKKLICIDLDGTFISKKSKKPDETDIIAIKNELKKKNYIMFNSGRCVHSTHEIIKSYFNNNFIYIGGGNGSTLFHPASNKTIYKNHIPVKIVKEIIELTNKFKGDWVLWQGEKIVSSNISTSWYTVEKSKSFEFLEGDKCINQDTAKIDVKFLNNKNDSDFKNELLKIKNIGFTHYKNKRAFEINYSNTKEIPIIKFKMNIDENVKVIAIGDDLNDIGMLKYADISVAMGSSPDKVKEICDITTSNQENHGIASFLERNN